MDIRDLCSDAVFYRGKGYWENGRVTKLNFDDKKQVWKGTVSGSEPYFVTVEKHTNGTVYCDCDCPAFGKYDSVCKHVVATLLEIEQKEANHQIATTNETNSTEEHSFVLPIEEKQTTDRIIQLFERHQMDEDQDHPFNDEELHVEYICKIVNKLYSPPLLSIEMKIGSNRLYVVKKIKEFLKSVANRESHWFTQKFTYDPSEQYFSPEDEEIFDLLIKIANSEEFYHNSRNPYTANASNQDRGITIPPLFADELFVKLSNRILKFDDGWDQDQALHWVEEMPPLAFQLEKLNEDSFSLAADTLQDFTFFKSYNYILYNHILYKVSASQFNTLMGLQTELPNQSKFYIEPSQIDKVISNVVPTLKKMGTVEISETVSDKIINPPLHPKLMIDRDEKNHLIATLEYHYGDIVIDPLRNEQLTEMDKNIILMREMDKENHIMTIIEHAPLKWNGSQLFIEDELDMYEFLFEDLPRLEQTADVFMSTDAKSWLNNNNYTPKTDINLDTSSNLLDITFGIEGIDPSEVQDILQTVIERKKYYRFANGSFLSLEQDDFDPIRELFRELDVQKGDVKDQKLQTSTIRGLQIEDILKNGHPSVKLQKSFRDLLDNMKHPENLEFETPESLKPILRDYQTFGFQWLKTLAHYRFGGILADDMGLGKTLQSIAFILSEKEVDESNRPTLIISPASLVYNWENECKKFAPNLKTAVMVGDKEERESILNHSDEVDVIITSYPLIRRDIDLYMEKSFHLLILDEAQAIKNFQTQTAQAVRQIKAGKRFALSGTPIENSLEELWSIFQVILPGLFPGKKGFAQIPQERISRMVRPFILRRMKKDVLKELPDKIETLQISELTEDQKKLYVGYLEKIQQETRESLSQGSLQQNRMKILAGLTRLRQLCCHPSLFIENYEGSSGKFDELRELIQERVANGKRILIFSQFTSMLAIIREELDKNKIDYFYLDGQTEKKKRLTMTEQFNNGENSVFLISLKAGGTGLNLTGADTVILYDLWWNPAVDQQAIDRAHRLGQKNVVQVIRFITHGTIEEKIYNLQQKKKELVDNVINPGETLLSGLSEDEIREILDL